MATAKDNFAIEKLSAKNYSTWKFKVEMLLTKEDLFHVITDDPPNPITDAWSKNDKKARVLINLTIDDNQIIREFYKQPDKHGMHYMKYTSDTTFLVNCIYFESFIVLN